jgi:acyl-coenzyme A thioesterase PaaI-like protein
MASYSKQILSGSVDGKPIAIAAVSTPGTLLHTGPTITTTLDEIWLYAMNTHTAAIKLTVEWGDATTANNIEYTVPAENGLYLIAPGLLLKGNATALTVKAFAPTAGVSIHGYINQIA